MRGITFKFITSTKYYLAKLWWFWQTYSKHSIGPFIPIFCVQKGVIGAGFHYSLIDILIIWIDQNAYLSEHEVRIKFSLIPLVHFGESKIRHRLKQVCLWSNAKNCCFRTIFITFLSRWDGAFHGGNCEFSFLLVDIIVQLISP